MNEDKEWAEDVQECRGSVLSFVLALPTGSPAGVAPISASKRRSCVGGLKIK